MAVERKIYLPKWLTWFGQLFIVPMWGWLTYLTFFAEETNSELGVGSWLLITIMLGGTSVILLLMGYRKLPAYVIREEEK